ncbi:MAG: C69 family dipeptidase [Bacteroidota bacterium]|nr:C69 family dipeptidase [Bacteroidota bacterium]
MKKFCTVLFLILTIPVFSCTNIIVTKGASKDGSVLLAYTNDAEYIYHLQKQAARDYAPGEMMEFHSWRSDVTGRIPQAEHTYELIGFHMNEHQVAVGETTFTGREELWNHSKFLQYWHLMRLGLERAKTAREAVEIITGLAEKYGYGSEGESFSLTDPNEAWILEMTGTGDGGEGAIWVAVKIPDGMISCHANKARIGTFPLDDPENCMYSDNVISFAVEHGYYDPESGEPFAFNEAYCPSTPANLRYCSSRVWNIMNRAAPSANLSIDYNRGVEGAERYPLWVKPDEKLGVEDVMDLLRDHYEGTEIDMTRGYDAGPFGNPNRNRPLTWEVDGVDCAWERPVSTYNTAFSFIAQSRDWLPDEVGGLIWFGVDDTYFTVYVPLYNSITEIPKPFKTGDLRKFSWDSAWWVFNFVANYCNIRYSDMVKDMQAVQDSVENFYLLDQHNVDEHALALLEEDKEKARKYLTTYAAEQTGKLMKVWIALGEHLITKYNDGYVKNEKGRAEEKGYPDDYRRNTLKNRETVKLPVWNEEEEVESPKSY